MKKLSLVFLALLLALSQPSFAQTDSTKLLSTDAYRKHMTGSQECACVVKVELPDTIAYFGYGHGEPQKALKDPAKTHVLEDTPPNSRAETAGKYIELLEDQGISKELILQTLVDTLLAIKISPKNKEPDITFSSALIEKVIALLPTFDWDRNSGFVLHYGERGDYLDISTMEALRYPQKYGERVFSLISNILQKDPDSSRLQYAFSNTLLELATSSRASEATPKLPLEVRREYAERYFSFVTTHDLYVFLYTVEEEKLREVAPHILERLKLYLEERENIRELERQSS